MKFHRIFLLVAVAALSFAATNSQADDWIQLFNGQNLDGWTVKIKGFQAGDNFGNTFRVNDGVMQVGYESYKKFDRRFGHIFYKEPFSNYIIRVEYRFIGEQVPEGPGWAIRNSGIMLHGQSADSMGKDQDFPVSIEVQLLGGNGKDKRTTGNLCTPGTNVVMKGELIKRHCISAKSKTYHGEQWVTAEVEVRGSQIVRHKINGEVVLEYTEPQLDERDPDAKKQIEKQGGEKLLTGGYISLQSESHPIEFRKVELKRLEVGAE